MRRRLYFDMQHAHIPKKIILALIQPLSPSQVIGPRHSDKNPDLICFIYIAPLSACKILTTALVIAKFKYLTFDPLGGVKGVR